MTDSTVTGEQVHSVAINTESFPAYLKTIDRDRLRRYTEYIDFYNGTQWTGTAKRNERRLTFNYAKVNTDKITSYLLSSLNFAIDPSGEGNTAGAQAAEDMIYQVYGDNNLEALDFETEVDTAILGDGCYKVTWDHVEKRVRVTAPDMRGVFAWWIGDDTSRVWKVASQYTITAEAVRMIYGHTPDKEQCTITEVWTDTVMDLWMDGYLMLSQINPYGFIPFVIFPNLREPKQFWGISDLPQMMESQRELNRALSQLSKILEVSGNPIAVLENVEASEDITVKPGAVWNIPEDAKAYLLDLLQGGGVRLHIDYIDLVYRTMHDISEAPRAAFGGIERDLSGVALEIELHPLLQKVKRKRTIRTTAYKRRNWMILKLLEQYGGYSFGQYSQRIIWGSVLPQDDTRQTQNEQILVQSGVHSRRTAMDELGIKNPEEEFARWMEERRQILEQNNQMRVRSTRGGERERAFSADTESID